LDFDGKNDSLFHEFDQAGNKHMDYILERGTYTDVPMDEMLVTFKEMYLPEYFESIDGDLYAEADAERAAD